ncbi:MAG: tetratricopeptide repeat protein [Alphaproteobacteria bacterium]|nr:tetratricopeptide repeat protein [Alphaproteobacteria bacterium]
MRGDFVRTLTGVALAAALAACAPEAKAPEPPANPKLDVLFAQLQKAPDAPTAKMIEDQIWATWAESGSPTIDILMERAQIATASGDTELAKQYLDEATRLKPDFAEAWNRRAILSYDQENYGAAIEDIQEALKREPRHFGALAGLGMIYESLGQERAALAAYEDAIAVNPHLEQAKQGVARLSPKIAGRET